MTQEMCASQSRGIRADDHSDHGTQFSFPASISQNISYCALMYLKEQLCSTSQT